MTNQIILEGRLDQDPDIKLTKSGLTIAKFSVATSTLWQDRTREWHKQIHWHNIVVSRASTVQWIKDVLKQGALVRIKGTLIYRHWEDCYGQHRRTAQILVSEEKGSVEDLRLNNPRSAQSIGNLELETNSEKSHGERLDLETIPFLSHPLNQPLTQQ